MLILLFWFIFVCIPSNACTKMLTYAVVLKRCFRLVKAGPSKKFLGLGKMFSYSPCPLSVICPKITNNRYLLPNVRVFRKKVSR